MNTKNKLKKRLLEIPMNSRAYREANRLSDDINEDLKKIEFYLNELVQLEILIKKTQYICHNCSDTIIMSDETLTEFIDEDGYFECDNCMSFINPKEDKTGFFYYDIKDKRLLEIW